MFRQFVAGCGEDAYPGHVPVLREQPRLHGLVSRRHLPQSSHDEPHDEELLDGKTKKINSCVHVLLPLKKRVDQ